MKPVIGIVPLIDEEKESIWMLPGYMDGITEAGGLPIILPMIRDPETIRQMLKIVQGILLTGGHDVDPLMYGENPLPECGAVCKERDAMETELLKQCLEKDIPVLGICRGIQFLNVYLGGTLYQDLPTQHPTEVEHHQKPPYDVPVHRVDIAEDSKLFRILGKKTLSVNSYHHQAVKSLAETLKAMAVSEDGIIEAVEMPGKKFVWALQWHPEFSHKTDENSRMIFHEFVNKCNG